MAVPATPLVPKDGVLTITDSTATPLSFEVVYEDGDFSFSGQQKERMARVSFKDRGKTYAARETEDEDVEFSFTCHAVGFTDASTGTIWDVVKRTGTWAAAKSTLPAASGGGSSGDKAYYLQVKFLGERTDFSGTADSAVIYKYCALKIDFAEGIPGKFSISGTSINISTDAESVT